MVVKDVLGTLLRINLVLTRRSLGPPHKGGALGSLAADSMN